MMGGFDKQNDLVLNGTLETYRYSKPLTCQYTKPLLIVRRRGRLVYLKSPRQSRFAFKFICKGLRSTLAF